jgi:hypothetical protein
MAMTAQQYLASLSPEEQQQVNTSLQSSGSSLDQWYQAAINAGDPRAVRASGATEAEGADPSQNYSSGGQASWQDAAPSSEWLGKRAPTPRELRRFARDQGWSEDFARFDDRQLAAWLQQGGWDVNAGKFAGGLEKPTETGGYLAPSGGGGGGGGGGAAGSGTFGGAPGFDFTAPTYEEAMADPGYQFALGEGNKALTQSQAAKGVLRTGGSLKDLLKYGQDMATQQYGNVYNRQYALAKDQFAPQYGSWQTTYDAALQKYLQRENNIYGLLNQPMPSYG